jgi:CheY-like chemotaxis protein
LRILCVDDDGLVLSVTADLLRDLGHEVVEASDGRRAAQAIDDMPSIDMLITDIHMPGNVGGKELAAIARSKKPGLPVIYFSGLSHVLPAGMDGVVLRKPCSLGELQQAIDGLQA